MEEISRERAQTLMREGDLEGAIAVLKEVTAQNPGDPMAWQLMGGALGALGNSDESIGAFQQAAELQPASARVQFNLAIALIKSDRTSEARSHLEKALALDPTYEQARTRLKELGGIAPDTTTPPPPDPTLGGGPATAKPVASAPAPPPPPAPAATPAPKPVVAASTASTAPAPSLGGIGAPVAPKPAAPAPAPAAAPAPAGLSLQPIGGGLAPIGGAPAAAPAATPPGAPPAAPGGMAGLGGIGGIGGGGAAPAAPPAAAPLTPPPSAGPGGYAPPPSAYAPKPTAPSGGDYFTDGARSMGYDSTRGMQGDWDSATRGWNWGAFTFGWIWLWAHGLRSLAIGFFLGSWVLGALLFPLGKFGPIIINILFIAIQVGLGLMGHQLARMERTWDSADDFRDCQRIWALWSIPFVPIRLFWLGLIVLQTFAMGASSTNSLE